jgi:hypothetical protein
MKRAFLAALALMALALFAMPATAAQYDGIAMETSQSYLRLGFDDSIVVTVQLTTGGMPIGIANVPIKLNFIAGGDYVIIDDNKTSQIVTTNASGTGTATIRLNQDNQPVKSRLPQQVMVEAVATANDGIRNNNIFYITGTGSIFGYVVDDSMSTITGAKITVITPDGNVFAGGPYMSSDGTGSPMGYYQIDNLPTGLSRRNTLTAEKNGYEGTLFAEAGYDNILKDITIHGYKDIVDVTSIVNARPNATVTPVPTAENTDTPAKPTTMTTTIIIAIALIALVYLGLKAYRRMF